MRPDAGWHRSVTGMLRRTYEAAVEDNIAFLASALSFDLLLTAIPFIVLLLGAAGYLVQHQVTTQQIAVRELVEGLLPPHPAGAGDRFATLERLFSDIVANRARLLHPLLGEHHRAAALAGRVVLVDHVAPPLDHPALDVGRTRGGGVDHVAQRRQVVRCLHVVGQREQPVELRRHHVAVGDLVPVDQLQHALGCPFVHEDDGVPDVE